MDIYGFGQDGNIHVGAPGGDTIEQGYLGTDATGRQARWSSSAGLVLVRSGNRIRHNVISGNVFVGIRDVSGSERNTIVENTIGPTLGQTSPAENPGVSSSFNPKFDDYEKPLLLDGALDTVGAPAQGNTIAGVLARVSGVVTSCRATRSSRAR